MSRAHQAGRPLPLSPRLFLSRHDFKAEGPGTTRPASLLVLAPRGRWPGTAPAGPAGRRRSRPAPHHHPVAPDAGAWFLDRVAEHADSIKALFS